MHFNLQVQHDISRCQVLTSLGKDALCKTGCQALHETAHVSGRVSKLGLSGTRKLTGAYKGHLKLPCLSVTPK